MSLVVLRRVRNCLSIIIIIIIIETCTIVFGVPIGRHFLFTSSDTFAVGCILQPQHTAKNRTAKISAPGIAMLYHIIISYRGP